MNGNLHIVFNGEIYDYKEQKIELEAFGIPFRTHSDTEVLANTIQRYGIKALEQYLSFQYSPLEETFFKGIYKLMPGHMLLYKNGYYEIKTYFRARLTPGQWGSKTRLSYPCRDESGRTFHRKCVYLS